jgi:hypothetical protein
VLSGRGLCDELITRPQESYGLWCIVVCDLENLVNEEARAHWGLSRLPPKMNILGLSGRGLIDVTVFTFSTITTLLSIQRLPSYVVQSVHSI